MQITSSMAVRWIIIFIFLAFMVLVLPCAVLPRWYNFTNTLKERLHSSVRETHFALLSEVENTTKLLTQISSSGIKLARHIDSFKRQIVTSQSNIPYEVAPLLFEAFLIMPHIQQISYIKLKSRSEIFSYYKEDNNIFALYTNSSSSKFNNTIQNQTWYKQQVDPITGNLSGVPIPSKSFSLINTSWISKARESSQGYGSLETGWDGHQSQLFMSSFGMKGDVVFSLGFSMSEIVQYFSGMDFYGGSLYMNTQDGKEIIMGVKNTSMVVNGGLVSFDFMKQDGDQKAHSELVTCNISTSTASLTKIGERNYGVHCSPIEIMGVPSVYALVFPHKEISSLTWNRKVAVFLMIAMIVAVVLFVSSFVYLMIRAALREMHLCSSLIKQMEATQQAERKSMNKSLAFASASHDIRAALAGICGFIDVCYGDAPPGSEMESNLRQMDDCAKDLVGLLNSILDTSKIEAGKMQLDEEEFDLARLLEDAVDLYHPVGLKKDIDVVLDSYDGSVLKFSRVKGDRVKLKQVLCNLLSNAVKFTSEGHVSVRAWAQKPSLENEIIASNQNSWTKKRISHFFRGKKEENGMEAISAMKQNPNCMEFVFEVSDTGKGIPKDKQKSVFENFVQVRETALDQGGTGLGLGIVQSLVRLMGGEIGIVDKENGEKGTCFRFNVFLTTLGTTTMDTTRDDDEIQQESDITNGQQYPGLKIKISSPSIVLCTASPSWGILSPKTPRTEGSEVVLLIHNEERLRASKKFLEGLGIKVFAINNWELLCRILMRIKSRLNISPLSSSGKSDIGSRSDNSSSRWKDVPLSALDGIDMRLPSHRSGSIKGAPGFVLLVIDATSGPIQELLKAVAEFKKGLQSSIYEVVWLDKPISRSIDLNTLKEDLIDPNDKILLKPFHGSRLFQVIKLLPEFATTLPAGVASKSRKERTVKFRTEPIADPDQEGILEKKSSVSKSIQPSNEIQPARLSEIQEEDVYNQTRRDQPLKGLKFLVADDTSMIRYIAQTTLSKLGADVDVCENGQEALNMVRDGFKDQEQHRTSIIKPYDYILMDCKMPVMDGYEATRQIRMEEAHYGIHIPIMAATALDPDEVCKIYEAGMDYYLGKGINKDRLLKALTDIDRILMT